MPHMTSWPAARLRGCVALALWAGGCTQSSALDSVVRIPAGSFLRGCVPEDSVQYCEGDVDLHLALNVPARELSISEFSIDRYEVSIGEYVECVEAGECQERTLYEDARLPMTGVTWHDASAYCKWNGMRLPTEAEWEHAARGPENHIYPWGDVIAECGQANAGVAARHGLECDKNDRSLLPVDELGADRSGYGVVGMAGNAAEWCSDWLGREYYEVASVQDPQGPNAPEPGFEVRILRGSYYGAGLTQLTLRRWHRPEERTLGRTGFRCARSGE